MDYNIAEIMKNVNSNTAAKLVGITNKNNYYDNDSKEFTNISIIIHRHNA